LAFPQAFGHDRAMAGEAAALPWTSYADYLALERATDRRHEWLDGQVYAMAGGTLTHAELAAAVAAELRSLALPCGCKVFNSDAKVRVLATGLATYPDASMVCGPVATAPNDSHAMTNPALLVEVLSDGTEAYDRGDKAAHYRRIPSLQDYVFVSQHTRRVEVYSREGDHWTLRVAEAGGSVPLTALDGSLSVDRVYAGVELAEAPSPPTAERSAR
jgi:Uma2 family endonuclease